MLTALLMVLAGSPIITTIRVDLLPDSTTTSVTTLDKAVRKCELKSAKAYAQGFEPCRTPGAKTLAVEVRPGKVTVTADGKEVKCKETPSQDALIAEAQACIR